MTTVDPGPYSRVYWRFIEEFPDVYDDDRAFATWMRLLILAEGTHPQPAPLPHGIKNPVLTKLVDEGLVTLLPGSRYRVKGVAKERERRAEKGRKGASARWSQSDGNANALQPQSERIARAMPAEQSKDEQSKDETRRLRASGLSEELGTVYDRLNGNDPVPVDVRRLQKLAADLTGEPFVNVHSGLGLKAVNEQLPHGFDRVETAWRQVDVRVRAASGPNIRPTLRQLVFGADELLNAVPRPDSKERREDETKADYDRRVARTQREIAAMRGE